MNRPSATSGPALPAWFTATSIEIILDGPLAELTVETELAGLPAELSAEVHARNLLALTAR